MKIEKMKELNADKDANYFLDEDGSIIVIGNVDISRSQLKELPIKFSVVTGSFDCSRNHLTSFENFPKVIGGNLNCDGNELVELHHLPIAVGGRFLCRNNKFNDWVIKQLEQPVTQWIKVKALSSVSTREKLTNLSAKTGLFDL